MNNTEIFLEKYKELEAAAVYTYGLDTDGRAISELEKMPRFKYEKEHLHYCRDVRNFLQHTSKYNDEFLIVPSDQMILLLQNLIERVKNPPRCKNYWIAFDKVYSCILDDYVLPAMQKMKESKYTHIPILNNNKVIGVFSENSLFSYILAEGIVDIDKSTRFRDLAAYLPIENHITESFRFLPCDTLISDVKKIFEDALSRMERIGMIFLTQNGKETEKPLGILTSWDISGK